MRPENRELSSIGPFPLGANNLARETSVPRTQLREAVNVDLSDNGKARRRHGYTQLDALSHATSLFGYGERGFVLEGDELLAFEVRGRQLTGLIPIASGLQAGRLAHTLIEPDIFVSDGQRNLRIGPGNEVSDWTPPQPDSPAVMSFSEGGALDAGRYRAALTLRAADGTEGPPSPVLDFELSEGQYPTLSLPTAPAGYRAMLYMTKPNGRELLFVGSPPAGATSVNVMTQRLGRPIATDHMQAMPPGRHSLLFRGRLWVALGELLTASEPFQYGVTQLDFNTIPFSEHITGLGAAGEQGGGFFVGQRSKVYFLEGDSPGQMALREQYPAGMVEGTLTMIPGARLPFEAPPSAPVPIWLATNGVVCVGLPDGSVAPLTEGRYAAAVGKTGAGMFVQRDGESRYVTTTQDPDENTFAATDEVSYEVVRNGIVIGT